MTTHLMSVRIGDELKARLDALATVTEQTRNELVIEALERFVGATESEVSALQHAVEQADAGLSVPDEQVDAWLAEHGYRAGDPRDARRDTDAPIAPTGT